jgi:hypothetical protein
MFKAEPVDSKFRFSLHWIGEWIAGTDPSRIGMQTMADLDDDGDLDFAAGQRQTLPGGMVWWEHCTADHWVGHKVGTDHKSQAAGDARGHVRGARDCRGLSRPHPARGRRRLRR